MSIGPGATPLTLIPETACSIAAVRVRAGAACLLATYPAMPLKTVLKPCTEILLTMAPARLTLHQGQFFAEAEPQTSGVDGEQVIEVGRRHVHQGARPRCARVVEREVKTFMRPADEREQIRDILRVRDIRADEFARSPVDRYGLDGVSSNLFASTDDDHMRVEGRQAAGDGEADSCTSTGHERGCTLELIEHGEPPIKTFVGR